MLCNCINRTEMSLSASLTIILEVSSCTNILCTGYKANFKTILEESHRAILRFGYQHRKRETMRLFAFKTLFQIVKEVTV